MTHTHTRERARETDSSPLPVVVTGSVKECLTNPLGRRQCNTLVCVSVVTGTGRLIVVEMTDAPCLTDMLLRQSVLRRDTETLTPREKPSDTLRYRDKRTRHVCLGWFLIQDRDMGTVRGAVAILSCTSWWSKKKVGCMSAKPLHNTTLNNT
jgi:hypothetical protein